MQLYKKNIKGYWAFILLCLSSLFFYMPFGLEQNQILKLVFYISILIFSISYKEKILIKKDNSFDKYFIWMALSFFLSIFSSTIYRNQAFNVGLITTLPYFTYFLFFIFRHCNLSIQSIEKISLIMGLISASIILIDIFTFPNIWFGTAQYDIVRNGIRIRVPGVDWIILLFYFSLYNLFNGKNKNYNIIIAAFMYIAIICTLTRQIIIVTTISAVIYYIISQKAVYKILISLIFIFFILKQLQNIPVIDALIDMTEEQIYDNKYKQDDVRVNAWNFFVNDAQRNDITPIIGNGMYSEGKSDYGNKMARIQSETYCYLTDVGWASFYFLFGIFGLIPLSIIFLKSYTKIFNGGITIPFVLYLLFAGITSFTSGVILYQYQIIVITLSLYALTIITPKITKENGRRISHNCQL